MAKALNGKEVTGYTITSCRTSSSETNMYIDWEKIIANMGKRCIKKMGVDYSATPEPV